MIGELRLPISYYLEGVVVLIQFKEVTKVYKSSKVKALDSFSAEINAGEIIGLIGKNGSGKTTLMNCLTNNIHITSGEIFYEGQNLMDNKEKIAEFGILIESAFVDYLNAYQNLELLLLAEGVTDKKQIKEDVERVLSLVGLIERKKDFVKTFSFGMKQRLGLAQALLRDKKLLILDEPLVGLDVLGRDLVKSLIKDLAKKEGRAVIFSDHNLNEVKDVCDRIIYIDNGKKLFDDIFDDSKRYLISVDDSEKKHGSFPTFERKGDKIIVHDSTQLNDVIISITQQNLKIVDIEVSEPSLMTLFRGE
ncbi:ABC transporter ATP-binding protein [Neobacillus rhizosphaerae]|uniref:ABC transporter ATP-binding protein n=1 Tax=Neobacillus rhizosphaerae TaxID=2880965 RepID=UPI00200ECBC4|nr:ABC transporter ATP-binding protein [Neobacillus rhizosphaerae]